MAIMYLSDILKLLVSLQHVIFEHMFQHLTKYRF